MVGLQSKTKQNKIKKQQQQTFVSEVGRVHFALNSLRNARNVCFSNMHVLNCICKTIERFIT